MLIVGMSTVTVDPLAGDGVPKVGGSWIVNHHDVLYVVAGELVFFTETLARCCPSDSEPGG